MAVFFFTAAAISVNPPKASAQTATVCTGSTAPATTYGKVTQSVSVSTAGTYRVWARIKAPNTTANSFFFQVDNDASCTVGDLSTMPANTWTWVSYQAGNTSSVIYKTLTAASHTLSYTGREADVQLDRVLLLGDTACVPTGTGDNCAVVDATGPTVSVTAPAAGATVSGTAQAVTATASDASGVAKVEFLVDGALKTPADTTSPYTYTWDTTTVTNGSHTLSAKATDTVGNTTTSAAVTVTVNNPVPPPAGVTIPFRVNAAGPAFTDPSGAAWNADAYFTGGSAADRGAIAIAGTTNPTVYRTERWGLTNYNIPVANGTYTYRLHFAETSPTCMATGCRVFTVTGEGTPIISNLDVFAAAGATNTAVVKTGSITVADGNATFGFTTITGQPEINGLELLPAGDTTAPTAPTGLNSPSKTATSVSLAWTASTDNVGVTGYRVFRGATQVGTPTTTSYTDTGLAASTAYSYTVKAVDAAGNPSAASAALSVTTNAAADTTLPTVSLTAPASGASIAVGTTATLTATASDNVGVTKVEFYDGTTLLNSDTTSPYSYAWNTTGAPIGAHSLSAKAYDAAGNVRTSTVVSVSLTGSANLPGDVNGDSRVNALDLSALISHDGQNYPAADFNGDGTVGAADMAILLSKWTW